MEDNEIAAKRHKQRKTDCFYAPFASFRGYSLFPLCSLCCGLISTIKRLQHFFRQRGVEVIRDGELALGQADGTRLGKWRRIQNGEQAGRFLRQGFRALWRNPPMVNFNFNGQIAHGPKLRLDGDSFK